MRSPSPNIDGMGSLLYADGTARFRVWAPNASRVQVFGDFTGGSPANAIDLALEPGTGNWSADGIPVTRNDRYQYIITNPGGTNNIPGTYYRTDARAQQVESSLEASQGYIIDPAIFTTNRQPFTTPAFQDFLIYQLHVGSFAGRNDGIPVTNNIATFVDAIAKLDYIRGLGFNAIELLPITDFVCDLPGANLGGIGADEGYGPCDLFASEDAYATAPDRAVVELIQLIDAAHSKGLAVILDVVYNHAALKNNRYWQYDGNNEGYNLDDKGQPILGGIYFVKGHHTPWGEGFSLWQQEVKDFLLDNARMYLRDFRVDGLRFDAVQAIQPDALEYIVPALRSTFPDKYLIAEYNPNDPGTSVMPDIDPWGVFQFCAIWDMSSCYTDTTDMLNGSGPGAIVNNQRLFSDPNNWHHVMYLTGSHDQIYSGQGDGGLYLTQRFGGRTNGWALAKARLAWSLNATLPATPMLFMGTEGHMDGSWNPVVGSWGDLRLDWDKIGDPTGAPMQQLVRDVNQLRWVHSALRTASGFVTHNDPQNRIIAFKRYDANGDVLLVVLNPSDGVWAANQYGVSLAGDGGTWLEIFNSQAPVYGGIDTVGNYSMYLEAINGQIWINLPSWSTLIFARQ